MCVVTVSERLIPLILHDDLATLTTRRLIFHDVPANKRGEHVEPVLADAETKIDARRRQHLQDRLTRVITSSAAYPVRFVVDSASPVPQAVREYTAGSGSAAKFVKMSQLLANYLFALQGGAMSPGLLTVIDVVADGRPGIVLMKLEREAGAQLQMITRHGKRSFDMSVLDNLVLTDGTRLFKTGMFIRVGKGDDDLKSAVCDSQRHVVTPDDVARFWRRFLGVTVIEEPRVATERFFTSVTDFIREWVTDPVAKNDIYEHLHSEMKSKQKAFMPKKFLQDYVSEDYRKPLEQFLKERNVALVKFEKDLSDLGSRLKRRLYTTDKGATVTVPEGEEQLVVVEKDAIIVNDSLKSVR